MVASTPLLPYVVRVLRHRRRTLDLSDRPRFDMLTASGEATSLILVFLASLSWMAAGTYNPFLYFRF